MLLPPLLLAGRPLWPTRRRLVVLVLPLSVPIFVEAVGSDICLLEALALSIRFLVDSCFLSLVGMCWFSYLCRLLLLPVADSVSMVLVTESFLIFLAERGAVLLLLLVADSVSVTLVAGFFLFLLVERGELLLLLLVVALVSVTLVAEFLMFLLVERGELLLLLLVAVLVSVTLVAGFFLFLIFLC